MIAPTVNNNANVTIILLDKKKHDPRSFYVSPLSQLKMHAIAIFVSRLPL